MMKLKWVRVLIEIALNLLIIISEMLISCLSKEEKIKPIYVVFATIFNIKIPAMDDYKLYQPTFLTPGVDLV